MENHSKSKLKATQWMRIGMIFNSCLIMVFTVLLFVKHSLGEYLGFEPIAYFFLFVPHIIAFQYLWGSQFFEEHSVKFEQLNMAPFKIDYDTMVISMVRMFMFLAMVICTIEFFSPMSWRLLARYG